MENNSRFFENHTCEYFPCHKGLKDFNCLFCYCPFYAWEVCPGNDHYIDRPDGSRIKVCTDCTLPHVPGNYDFIMDLLRMGKEKYALSRSKIACKFYGIGVGPGDPKLITRSAEEIIKKVDVLILPAKDKESCRAYCIAEKEIPTIRGKECICLPFPMTMKEDQLRKFHGEVARQVESFLEEGRAVGFLTIGDVTVYSTFSYVEALVKEHGYPTEVINGITSFQAAAAKLGIPLALGSEELHIIPGSAGVQEALQLSGTLVFMKSGKRLLELKNALLSLEREQPWEVYAVSNCGLEHETVSFGAENISAESGYLTVVIAKRTGL